MIIQFLKGAGLFINTEKSNPEEKWGELKIMIRLKRRKNKLPDANDLK